MLESASVDDTEPLAAFICRLVCVSETVCMRMRAEGNGPTNANRGWSEGPEWGVWSAERSAEDKKKGWRRVMRES